MCRTAALVMLIAGCGRVGFDAPTGADGDAANGDGASTGPDEDGDGVPNAVDNCPVDSNPGQENRNEVLAGLMADDLGDACDPRPAECCDYIVLFDPHDVATTNYLEAGDNPGLTGSGALRVGDVDDYGHMTFTTAPQTTRLDVTFSIVEISNRLQWVGIWNDYRQGMRDALFAEAACDPTQLRRQFNLKQQIGSQDDFSNTIEDPVNLAPGERFRFVVDTTRIVPGAYRMTITDTATSFARTATLPVSISPTTTGYLEGNGIVADFEYLIVYAIR